MYDCEVLFYKKSDIHCSTNGHQFSMPQLQNIRRVHFL